MRCIEEKKKCKKRANKFKFKFRRSKTNKKKELEACEKNYNQCSRPRASTPRLNTISTLNRIVPPGQKNMPTHSLYNSLKRVTPSLKSNKVNQVYKTFSTPATPKSIYAQARAVPEALYNLNPEAIMLI